MAAACYPAAHRELADRSTPSSTCSSSRARSSRPSTSRASRSAQPEGFIRLSPVRVIVVGCAAYQAALHLIAPAQPASWSGSPRRRVFHRGVLGSASRRTAIADAAVGAGSQHLIETRAVCARDRRRRNGHRQQHLQGGRCGADAVMIGSPLARASEAPGRGYHWAWRPSTPAFRAAPASRPTRSASLEGS